ncbi:MAG: tripartite tricarboxylate transporter substrate binding protein [Aquisalimonadaceae bacterium]
MQHKMLASWGIAAIAALSLPFTAHAEYPERAITLVAPYGAGGSADLAGRALANAAVKYLDQPVQVVNRTGAGGVTGSAQVSRGKPDGYELLVSRVGSNAVTPALDSTIPYKYDDFTFIGLIEENPYVFVVNADSPYKTLEDLVTAIKENPGTLTYSTSGPGTILNMGPQMLFKEIGLGSDAAIMIPHDGGGGARTALVGGHVDFLGINLAPVLNDIKSGALRALSVSTQERYSEIPDVPTATEAGYPALHAVLGWTGLFGPPDLPQNVVDTWAETLQKIKNDEEWNNVTRRLGSVPRILPPDETTAFMAEQYEVYYTLGDLLDLRIE